MKTRSGFVSNSSSSSFVVAFPHRPKDLGDIFYVDKVIQVPRKEPMNWHKQLSEHKNVELEIQKFTGDDWSWADFHFKVTRHQDHAGVDLTIELFGFYLNVMFYDHRHWDYDKHDWCKYDEGEWMREYKGADGGTLGPED
jgi:hypothetical protein